MGKKTLPAIIGVILLIGIIVAGVAALRIHTNGAEDSSNGGDTAQNGETSESDIDREATCMQELANEQVGRNIDDVQDYIDNLGAPYEVRDLSQGDMFTTDFQPYRLNIEAENGEVTDAAFDAVPATGDEHSLDRVHDTNSCLALRD